MLMTASNTGCNWFVPGPWWTLYVNANCHMDMHIYWKLIICWKLSKSPENNKTMQGQAKPDKRTQCQDKKVSPGPPLLTWFNFHPSMDKLLHTQKSLGWNCLFIPKLQRLHRWCFGMDEWFHPTLYNECNYLWMLGLKLIRVSKRGHWFWKIVYVQRFSIIFISNPLNEVWKVGNPRGLSLYITNIGLFSIFTSKVW